MLVQMMMLLVTEDVLNVSIDVARLMTMMQLLVQVRILLVLRIDSHQRLLSKTFYSILRQLTNNIHQLRYLLHLLMHQTQLLLLSLPVQLVIVPSLETCTVV